MTANTSPTLHDVADLLRRVLATTVISNDQDTEAVLDSLNTLDAVTRRARELKSAVEDSVVSWIEANGDLHVPGTSVRYYAGTKKITKCVDARRAFEAVLDAAGGDLEAAMETLASNAIKAAAARKVLPGEAYGALFVTEEKPVLKEGKTSKSLIRVGERFVTHSHNSITGATS